MIRFFQLKFFCAGDHLSHELSLLLVSRTFVNRAWGKVTRHPLLGSETIPLGVFGLLDSGLTLNELDLNIEALQQPLESLRVLPCWGSFSKAAVAADVIAAQLLAGLYLRFLILEASFVDNLGGRMMLLDRLKSLLQILDSVAALH